tara:strand:- start:146 stop:361 length:216 start_codon:yes stop_codon:yes gene_type:complete
MTAQSDFMKIGDLVSYECLEAGPLCRERLGYITDVLDDGLDYPMYEVICTEPYDRGWFADVALKLVSEGKK